MQSAYKPHIKIFLLVLMISALPVFAQKGSSGGGGGSGGKGGGGGPVGNPGGISSGPSFGSPTYGASGASAPWSGTLCGDPATCPAVTTPRPAPATPTQEDATCFLPPIDRISGPTVSLTRLEIPEKTRHEYEKACSEVHAKKYSQAEDRLQKTVKAYETYPAAWVLLGQVQEAQHKITEADESCSRAIKIDSNYAPSYLCMAYLFAVQGKWNDVKQTTSHLLLLHPIHGSAAYYYNALAYFNLNDLASAEAAAVHGTQNTVKNHQPELHVLLARIYEKKGDRDSEISQLQEYLKLAPHGNLAAQVNNALKVIGKESAAAARP